ncbi:MAG: hypothetical protein KatS3mg110_2813 [Pirellulaceae bacterium]|nr:MAG: hypothetical protein KatS3mg110_2813 [Pirellulaceae bacterium]
MAYDTGVLARGELTLHQEEVGVAQPALCTALNQHLGRPTRPGRPCYLQPALYTECACLQHPVVQPESLAVEMQHFHPVPRPVDEYEQAAVRWIGPEFLLYDPRMAVTAFVHVRWPRIHKDFRLSIGSVNSNSE